MRFWGILSLAMPLPSEIRKLPVVAWESMMRIPTSVQYLTNNMTPLGYIFIRRFMVWFPICCLASSFIMQTHVIFDCSRQSIDEEELEFDDSSELSEEFGSPPNTNLNSPHNTGSTADTVPHITDTVIPTDNSQPQQPDNPPGSTRNRQSSDMDLPNVPSSWIDLRAPGTSPRGNSDRNAPN